MKRKDIISSLLLGMMITIFLVIIRFSLRKDLPPDIVNLIGNTVFIISVPLICVLSTYILVKVSGDNDHFVQFGKFMLVGFSNLAVDFGLLNLIMYIFDVDIGFTFSIIKAFSFSVAIINSFIWNKLWTFDYGDESETGKQFFKFAAVAITGLIINVVVASFIVNFIKVDFVPPRIWVNIGSLISLVAVLIWDFAGYKYLVFRR